MRRLRSVQTFALASAVAMVSSRALGQIASLDKGHQIIVDNGLQIWGVNTSTEYTFDYATMEGANINSVMWGFPAVGISDVSRVPVGKHWGKWTDWQYNGTTITPQTALNSTELARKSDLIALQVGDESNQSDMETGTMTRDWLNAARAGNVYPNTLLYVNSFFINSDAGYANFLANGNPDAICWDSYPFSNPAGHYITPYNWLTLAQRFRRHGLGSYIGATNASPRPYGMFVQTYHDQYAIDPGEAQIRWQQFTAWTLGYKFVDAFIYCGGNNNFYTSAGTPGSVYNNFKEAARQGRNLGPALTRLISYGYGTSIVLGKNSDGSGRNPSGDWLVFNQNQAPPNQRYLSGVSVKSLSHKNGVDPTNPDGAGGFYGYAGDVYIGFFNPLLASYGDPAGTTYFMVTNALGGDLTLPNGSADNTATAAECTQQITLNFDFGSSGINSLQRLRRSDGQVEVVPLTHLSGNQYRLIFTLEGGTGDLFKYNDGSPFVGVQAATLMYWDADASASGNNITTGTNLGGSGTWETATNRWFNGTSNAPWSAGKDAVFWGTGGTVSLSAAQSANSLAFKTNGYTITGSTLTMTGSYANADSGVTATIASTIAGSAGLNKIGAGTLNVGSANTYSGGTTINDGVLGIYDDGSLGAVPPSPSLNISLANGATLRFNPKPITSATLSPNRQIFIGAGGGTIDTGISTVTIAGQISGSRLTKTGSGTLALGASNTHSGTTITAGAVQIGSDGALGAVPGVTTAGNITLDGGTLRFGGNFDIHSNRGISLGAAGGTIDTNGYSTVSGYSWENGIQGSGDLVKARTGTFLMSTPSGKVNTLWTGSLVLRGGTWKINNTGGLPVNPTSGGLRAAQITFDGGALQFGAGLFASQPNRGMTVAGGGGTIDTNGFNVTWAGPITCNAASATLTKAGAGLLMLKTSATAAAYAGTLMVNAGSLQLDGGSAIGDAATIALANTPGAAVNFSGFETIGALSGGGSSGGNVTLNTISLTIAGSSSTTFAGAISGSTGRIVRGGSGSLLLTGHNTYGAGTTVLSGKLSVWPSAIPAADAVNVTGGTYEMTGPGAGYALRKLSITNSGSAVVSKRIAGINRPLYLDSLSLGALAKLDLNDNDLVLEYGTGPSAFTAVRDLVFQGYSSTVDGSKTGIISSTGQSAGNTILAVLDNALIGASDWPLGSGHTIETNSVIGKYTYFGDANLDGQVSSDDYALLDANLNTTPSAGLAWVSGDTNLDGSVTSDDYAILDSGLGQGDGNPLSPVPEPAALGGVLLAGISLRRVRRSAK